VAVQITVILDGSPGGLARVITALKRLGLAFSGHHIEALDDHRSRLIIEAAGRAAAGELHGQLRQVRGVSEVVRVSGAEADDGPGGAVPATDGGIESLAGRIVAEYPKILRYVDAFEKGFPDALERGQQLRLLGRRVGGKLSRSDANLHQSRTLSQALQGGVVPVLDQIAEPQVLGGAIRVRLSIFTRRQLRAAEHTPSAQAPRCDFLSGMIEGMIAGVESLPDLEVDETSCRSHGDDYCLFRIAS